MRFHSNGMLKTKICPFYTENVFQQYTCLQIICKRAVVIYIVLIPQRGHGQGCPLVVHGSSVLLKVF